jgi:hypothetical protein
MYGTLVDLFKYGYIHNIFYVEYDLPIFVCLIFPNVRLCCLFMLLLLLKWIVIPIQGQYFPVPTEISQSEWGGPGKIAFQWRGAGYPAVSLA